MFKSCLRNQWKDGLGLTKIFTAAQYDFLTKRSTIDAVLDLNGDKVSSMKMCDACIDSQM